jgi:formyltetrahydrofolate deformylase
MKNTAVLLLSTPSRLAHNGSVLHSDDHLDSGSDMSSKGRDLEKVVLSRAVRWHLGNRILVYQNKTVVFI